MKPKVPLQTANKLLLAGCRCLYIGTCKAKIKSFINVGNFAGADICIDISKESINLKEDSVDLIYIDYAKGCAKNMQFSIRELYRVSKNNSLWLLDLPPQSMTRQGILRLNKLNNIDENVFKSHKIDEDAYELAKGEIDMKVVNVDRKMQNPGIKASKCTEKLTLNHLQGGNDNHYISITLKAMKKDNSSKINKEIERIKPEHFAILHNKLQRLRAWD